LAADGSIRISTELDTAGLQSSLDKMNSMVEKGMKIAQMSIAGLAVGEAVKKLGEIGIEFNMQMQSLQASFETMTGSAEQATSLINNLKTMAAATPFEVTGLADASKVMMSFGESVNDLLPDLKMLGDISQGDSQKLKGLALVYGQVQSAGKLMGQDLLQMINNGFNPLQVISQKTGEAMSSLRDKVSKGQISFDDLRQAMIAATSEGGLFFNAMEKQSHTLQGQLSTLSDNFHQKMGSIMEPLVNELTNKAVPALNDFLSTADFRGVADGLNVVLGLLKLLVGSLKEIAVAAGIMFAAMKINAMVAGYQAALPVVADLARMLNTNAAAFLLMSEEMTIATASPRRTRRPIALFPPEGFSDLKRAGISHVLNHIVRRLSG